MAPDGVSEAEAREWVSNVGTLFDTLDKVWRTELDMAPNEARTGLGQAAQEV